ncbi:hypothetical protein SAMN06295885_3569 [Rathayibacter oskolensis]|uniref:Uncharacterized protein n=1 Tax=Rathayibacter oskolensis TaxID=1891671 RepID=A0A1X7PI36_9MICO|nr:hypothetical protein [Rathayibacter oskolensis]SMH50544.1 hypothetical protein SAMN06295885_3569 [Rathayibacter oskolensis]
MADAAEYHRTSLDWPRLAAFARRVATETRVPPTPAWTYEATVRERVKTREASTGFLGLGARPAAYTETVTRATQVVLPRHWVLDRREWHYRSTFRGGGVTVEERIDTAYVSALLTTGELKWAWLSRTETWNHGSSGSRLVVPEESTHSMEPLTAHATDFDFERRHHDSEWSGSHSWGDRDPGARPIRHAKGVGLSLALKALLG